MRTPLSTALGVSLILPWAPAGALTVAAQDEKPKTGTIVGRVESKKDTPDGKNTFLEVLAPGEEKPHRYHVLYDAKAKGPIESVLTAVRAAKVGDRVELEWVQTGHGPAIQKFKVLPKAGDRKKD
jgi:hypothetical protein